jgi:hypothetical protein
MEMLTCGGDEGGGRISAGSVRRRPATRASAVGQGARRQADGALDADRHHAAPGDGDFLRRVPLPPDWEMVDDAWLTGRAHKAAAQRKREQWGLDGDDHKTVD